MRRPYFGGDALEKRTALEIAPGQLELNKWLVMALPRREDFYQAMITFAAILRC